MYSNGHYGYVDGSSLSAELMKNPVESMSLGHRAMSIGVLTVRFLQVLIYGTD